MQDMKARRGPGISGAGVTGGYEPPEVDPGNQGVVFCKSRPWSPLLAHFYIFNTVQFCLRLHNKEVSF